jgi:hypothetical protein
MEVWLRTVPRNVDNVHKRCYFEMMSMSHLCGVGGIVGVGAQEV